MSDLSMRIGAMKISAVHAQHTEDSVGYVFDFDEIKVYISGDAKNYQKLNKVASFCAVDCLQG